MDASERRALLAHSTPVVVKVGTNVLTDESGRLDRVRMQALADQIARRRVEGQRVVLVSSGAIGAGVGRLNLGKRPTELPHLQACAAVGQTALMQTYQECLAPHGISPAQILLTAGDFDSRGRYLNVRHTIRALFEFDCIPIINENDTVSVAEIRFGDNDQLAAMVANLLQAPLLILLTNVDGLFSGDPRIDSSAKRVAFVPHIDRSVTELAGTTKSTLGTGGMRSKLRAARLATAAGVTVLMANGATPEILDRLFAGEDLGTLFFAHGRHTPAWKRWLGYTARPRGSLILDAGAVTALCMQGKSLLPVGVLAVTGAFSKGDVVSLCDANGLELARGLTNYSHTDAEKMRGLNTEQILRTLGKRPYAEIVHRDNLALLV
jgi:glutamate 5-kinase